MKSYDITLPLPPKECSPNASVHWAKKAKAVKKYRALCHLLFRQARIRGQLPAFQGPIKVDLTFYLCRKTAGRNDFIAHDADNARAAFKAGMDAMQDAGLIKTDSAANVKMGETFMRTKAKGEPEERHEGKALVAVRIWDLNG